MTNITSKLTNKYTKSRLLSLFNKHNIINNLRFGFKFNVSPNNAILEVVNAMDDGNKCTVIFIGLVKAFDTVNYKILLENMELLEERY